MNIFYCVPLPVTNFRKCYATNVNDTLGKNSEVKNDACIEAGARTAPAPHTQFPPPFLLLFYYFYLFFLPVDFLTFCSVGNDF